MRSAALVFACAMMAPCAPGETLPGAYFSMMEKGIARVETRLAAEPGATLRQIEEQPGWRHFPHSILAAAVMYSRDAPGNRRYRDAATLALALRIGDLLAAEDERGEYYWRLDSYWDTYMWLEAYRLLEPRLGDARRARWRACLTRNVGMVAARSAEWRDFPAYTANFIGTSTNHFALWAANLMIAGRLFSDAEWRTLGEHVLGRLATTEQTRDGYWGEHSPAGPTSGYNLLTLAAVGVFWEYTKDPAALEALRRATDFHLYFTYPDGRPVEVLNDRNRSWELNIYGNFAFTQGPSGRRFAQFLFAQFPNERLDMESLGRIAQNALYYHDGTLAPIPQARSNYARRLAGPAGVRKAGPWVATLSGLIATRPLASQWFLDRQAHLSVFHQKAGLILSGGNSRRQPEIATFAETTAGTVQHLPLDSRLDMTDAADRLWLAYNSFFSEIEVPRATGSGMDIRFKISGRGPAPESARLALQLVLHPGEELETAAGVRVRLDQQRVTLNSTEIAGAIRHHGWSIETGADCSLVWPVYPYSPYRNGPETRLDRAVGVLTFPLRLKSEKDRFVRPNEQVISVRLKVR
ncbi:MAG TPA: hypothetical protein VN442_09735 [Bryobacteraceae bacterium]|nr:hypothetical protein [Bryobacteraceae bacterium]